MRADVAFTACPHCASPPRVPCVTPAGDPLRSGPHAARTTAYSTSQTERQENTHA